MNSFEVIQLFSEGAPDLNRVNELYKLVQWKCIIDGLHMTSLKFKLKNYRSYPDLTFTNFHTNFRFKRVLSFVIEYA